MGEDREDKAAVLVKSDEATDVAAAEKIATKDAELVDPHVLDVIGTTADGAPRRLVLFDGMCRLCMGFVGFVIDRDSKDLFRFAPLQSELGQKVLAWHGHPADLDSVLLEQEGQCLIRSEAALTICSQLDGWASGLRVFMIIPQSLRDFGYEMVAYSRYSVFGSSAMSQQSLPAERFSDTWEPDPKDPKHVCGS